MGSVVLLLRDPLVSLNISEAMLISFEFFSFMHIAMHGSPPRVSLYKSVAKVCGEGSPKDGLHLKSDY